jgi:Tol biopolymer transport system component
MGIYQRDLTGFDQDPITDNRLLPGSCMNCHSFQANDPGNMMFHLRGDIGGTILVQDGKTVKLNTKTNETISNCVYPYWHPSQDFIAFSVNNIQQVFHSVKEKRIEVFDSRSDIVVYDIRNNKLITSRIISSDECFETFPAFSPDGKQLFFCSAKKGIQPDQYDRIKYSLCSIDFDASSGTLGSEIDTIVSSFRTGKSVSFPRMSPDGKNLVFTLSDYGNFSIWHREADLFRLDPVTGNFSPIDEINSSETESYHSWSSNSRWMIFSSRRMDGLYTHPYITYVSENGSFSKPFMVPQKDPDFYEESLRSFNVPEFVTGKVRTDGRSMLKTIGSPAKDVNFELK